MRNDDRDFLLFCLVVIVVCGAIVIGIYSIVSNNAEERCAALGAKAHFTYQTRYLCVTPDGRIVG